MSIEIYLIRHGKTAGNLKGAYIGRTDESLCRDGVAAIQEKIAAKLYPADPGILLSSPMKRCLETAKLLFPSAEPKEVTDFRETDFGDFEAKTYSELNGNPDYQHWIDAGGSIPFPNGEAPEVFRRRCADAFSEEMKKLADSKKVTIICHGGTIMAILDAFSAPHLDFYSWQVKNGDGFRCKYDPDSGKLSKIIPLAGQEEQK